MMDLPDRDYRCRLTEEDTSRNRMIVILLIAVLLGAFIALGVLAYELSGVPFACLGLLVLAMLWSGVRAFRQGRR